MKPALRVIAPGLMTTLQDLGRFGYQQLGVPVSGALDPVSLRAANLLVGNEPSTAALEIAFQGPTLAVEADSARVAVVGGTAPLEILDGEGSPPRRIPLLQSIRLTRGQILRVGSLSGSKLLYLAVEGGFDVPPVLGSRSTYTRASLGGFHGRALQPGDLLPLAAAQAAEREERMLPKLDLAPPSRVRVVLGPQDDFFSPDAIAAFLAATYTVSPASDRMGMRLEGPPVAHAKGFNIVSDGIAPGSIQIPGNGLPIILLADRQSTGGYPKIATVISADLPALGRLLPGARIGFEAVSIEAAEAAYHELAARLGRLARQIGPVRNELVIDEAKLMQANLVSGMIDAHALSPYPGD